MLWTLVYRDHMAKTTIIEASSISKAREVADAWLAQQDPNTMGPRGKYVNLYPFIVADESILPKVTEGDPEIPVKRKPILR